MPPPLTAHSLVPPDDLLAAHAALYGETPGDRVLSLARALVTSPPWDQLADRAKLVVRRWPVPGIAVVGRFVPADDAAVAALGWQVRDSLERLRAVSYDEAERYCGRLAQVLLLQLGEERLRSCRVVGLPRGGLIVAGMLAYSLGLSHDQLTGPTDGRETVVVDDCVLSGARTRRWLDGHRGRPVVLAHLHSHPELRRTVERDPRVALCLAAEDLHDHAPQRQGDLYAEWQARWAERSTDDFWTGHPDHVCYPWNEPDTVFWNEISQRTELGWHVVPPEWSLKNRTRSRVAGEVQRCASFHVPQGVLWANVEDVVVLARGGSQSLELSGTAVDVWAELVSTGDPASAADALARRFSVARDVVLEDVSKLAADLRRGGWWSPDCSPDDG